MYETMLAKAILAAVAKESAAQPDLKPIRANVRASAQYPIDVTLLKGQFRDVACGTPCENVSLHLEQDSASSVSQTGAGLILEQVEFE